MTAALLVIHILLAVALVGVILMQRTSSDGGGLTGGGSSSMGGLMTVRGTANLLTRTTSFLATGFIVTSILLTILGGTATRSRSIAEDIKPEAAQDQAQPPSPLENPLVPGAKDAPRQSVPTIPLSK